MYLSSPEHISFHRKNLLESKHYNSSIKSDKSLKLEPQPLKLNGQSIDVNKINQSSPNEVILDSGLENHHEVNSEFTKVDLKNDSPETYFEKKNSTVNY